MNWGERRAYFMEFHLTQWIPRLVQVENLARGGRFDVARQRFFELRASFLAGVPKEITTYTRPDPGAWPILQRAGYRFDIDQAGRIIEQRTGVAFLSGVLPPRPQPAPGPVAGCRQQRTPPSNGIGEWVVWSTPQGWLHIGTRAELARPQPQREEIWGGNSSAPLVKTPLPGGPFATREQALEEMTQYLGGVNRAYHALATPRETIAAVYNGVKYNLRFGRGKGISDIMPSGWITT